MRFTGGTFSITENALVIARSTLVKAIRQWLVQCSNACMSSLTLGRYSTQCWSFMYLTNFRVNHVKHWFCTKRPRKRHTLLVWSMVRNRTWHLPGNPKAGVALCSPFKRRTMCGSVYEYHASKRNLFFFFSLAGIINALSLSYSSDRGPLFSYYFMALNGLCMLICFKPLFTHFALNDPFSKDVCIFYENEMPYLISIGFSKHFSKKRPF